MKLKPQNKNDMKPQIYKKCVRLRLNRQTPDTINTRHDKPYR